MLAETKHRIWSWTSFWYALCGRCARVTASASWQDAFGRLCQHVGDEHPS